MGVLWGYLGVLWEVPILEIIPSRLSFSPLRSRTLFYILYSSLNAAAAAATVHFVFVKLAQAVSRRDQQLTGFTTSVVKH